MIWNIKKISQQCAVSGERFFDGDEVYCFICKQDTNEYIRYDVLKKNLKRFVASDEIVGKWTRIIHSDESENRSSIEKLGNQEEFFFSLFEGNETEEKKMLKLFFALLLERSKILRSEYLKDKSVRKYIHIKSGKEFYVTYEDSLFEKLTSLENVIEMLG